MVGRFGNICTDILWIRTYIENVSLCSVFGCSLRTGVKFSTRQEGVKKDKNRSIKDDVHGSILREERNGRLGICCVCYHRGSQVNPYICGIYSNSIQLPVQFGI